MISVIIVNYHSAGILQQAVESVLHDEDGTVEILVVDNTATDEERWLLRELSQKVPFTLLCNDVNAGFGKACNRAYERSRGEFIFLLNPDAYVKPGCLDVLSDYLHSRKDVGAVSPQVFWDDGMTFLFPLYPGQSPLEDLLLRISDASPSVGRVFSLYERFRNVHLWTAKEPVRTGNLSGGVVMLSREAVERSGGLFDERFFLFFEDTDLFLRMRNKGFRLAVHPGAKAVHHYEQRRAKLEVMEKTRPLFVEKHYRASILGRISGWIPHRSRPLRCTDHGEWDRPPVFPVSVNLRNRFLFEWSPSPHFVPAIGCFTRGDSFAFPGEIWECLDPGRYFSRMSHPRSLAAGMESLCWGKSG